MKIESWFAYDKKRGYVHAGIIAALGVLAGGLYLVNVEYAISVPILVTVVYLAFDQPIRRYLIHRALRNAATNGDAHTIDALSSLLVSALLGNRNPIPHGSHSVEEAALKYLSSQSGYDTFLLRTACEVTHLD